MAGESYEGGLSRADKWGCVAASVVGLPIFAALLFVDALGDCAPDAPCRKGFLLMQQYQMAWGRLPQVKIPAGPVLKRGSKGKRVDLLRQRLGLPAGGGYDERLFQAVATYQTVHGIGRADGIAGKGTIASMDLSLPVQRRHRHCRLREQGNARALPRAAARDEAPVTASSQARSRRPGRPALRRHCLHRGQWSSMRARSGSRR